MRLSLWAETCNFHSGVSRNMSYIFEIIFLLCSKNWIFYCEILFLCDKYVNYYKFPVNLRSNYRKKQLSDNGNEVSFQRESSAGVQCGRQTFFSQRNCNKIKNFPAAYIWYFIFSFRRKRIKFHLAQNINQQSCLINGIIITTVPFFVLWWRMRSLMRYTMLPQLF